MDKNHCAIVVRLNSVLDLVSRKGPGAYRTRIDDGSRKALRGALCKVFLDLSQAGKSKSGRNQ